MTDFLALALGQRKEEDGEEKKEEEISFEFNPAVKKVLGASFVQKRPPDPQKTPEGESFDSLSPWTSSLNDQRRGGARQWRANTARPSRQARPAGPLALETSPGFSAERKSAPAAYFVTPPGLDRWGVLTERLQAQRARNEGQSELTVAYPEEIALLGEVQRAERAISLVQGPQRNLTVTVPETAEGETAGLTVETLDRAAERDARRYDGGFSMY